jgi:hypothetical protein
LKVKTASRESSVGDCLAFWPASACPLRLRTYGALQGMLRVTRRAALIWVVLFGLYAATVGMRETQPIAERTPSLQYDSFEAHYLLTARSIVEDGNVNVFDEYRAKAYRGFYPSPWVLQPSGVRDKRSGTFYEPTGVGFPLLIAPAYALGGAHAVELFIAALAALAVALAYLIAVRVVPDPWALTATLAVGVSPPLLAYSATIHPEVAAGALLAGAALLALDAAERPGRWRVFGCFALLAVLPWLSARYVPAGLAIAVLLIVKLARQRHGLLALLGAEIAGFSGALYVAVNEGLYGGVTPHSAARGGGPATGAHTLSDYASRAPRVLGVLIDRDAGLLRWSPVLALAFVGVWLLWRGHRERLGQALPAYGRITSAAGLCVAACGAQFALAVFLAPSLHGGGFPGRQMIAVLPLAIPLVGWGFRHAPRTASVLALIGLVASVWLYVDVRFGAGGLEFVRPDAPWGPLDKVFPRFDGSTYTTALTAGACIVLLLLIWRDSRQWRQLGATT